MTKIRRWAAVSAALTLCAVVTGILVWKKVDVKPRPLLFWIAKPVTFDPIEHDLFVHHVLQRPVLSTLVSQYKSGEITGVLAESWKVSDDKKSWSFVLRDNVTFEDGSRILPSDVKRSLTRTAFLMRKNKSKSGLLDNLLGYDEVDRIDSDFRGISITDSTVTFHCAKEPAQFLEKISFGLYSVVHKDDYDPISGEWRNPGKVISSGQYRVHASGAEHFDLELRHDFPADIFPNRKFAEVRLTWSDTSDADVYFGDSITPPRKKTLTFWGGVQNQIAYLRAVSWKDPNSPFHDKNDRIALRKAFYGHLNQAGFSATLSFLPLAISGVTEFSVARGEGREARPITGTLRLADTRSRGGWREAALTALANASRGLGIEVEFAPLKMETYRDHTDPDYGAFEYDAMTSGTGVLIEQPLEDLRFMVLSKEGIRLPDPTGRLAQLVSKPAFFPQEMNEILWDDALVWPLKHSASGLWIDDSRVDFSLLNSTQPPTELALIQPR